jgi:hypothetical protein
MVTLLGVQKYAEIAAASNHFFAATSLRTQLMPVCSAHRLKGIEPGAGKGNST